MKFADGNCPQSDKSQGAKNEDSPLNWASENLWKPAYNAGAVAPYNAVANAVNFVRSDTIEKIKPKQIREGAAGSVEWHAQTFSGAVASTVPYAVAGQLAGGLTRASGSLSRSLGQRCLPAADALALTLPLEKMAANKYIANVLGAVAYDGLRDTQEGETRLGNMAGGAAVMGIFSFSKRLTGGAKVWEKPALYFGIGSAGGTAQALTSHLVSEGSLASSDQLKQAAMSGGWTNLTLPLTHHVIGKITDRANLAVGRGISLESYLERTKYKGDSPTLNTLIEGNPLVRVQTHNKEIYKANHEKNRIDLQENAKAAKLGHELKHLDRKTLIELESQFVDARKGINTPEAERLYVKARIAQEIACRKAENEIATESKEHTNSQQDAAATISPKSILREIAHDGLTYEQLFQREFHESFLPSDGKFRPQLNFSGPTRCAITLEPVPGNNEGFLPPEIFKDYLSDHYGPDHIKVLCDADGNPAKIRFNGHPDDLSALLQRADDNKWRPEIGGHSLSLEQVLAAAETGKWRPTSLALHEAGKETIERIAAVCPHLERLDIQKFLESKSHEPVDFSPFTGLKHLGLGDYLDPGLSTIRSLSTLESLRLPGSRITEAGLTNIGSLSKLKLLDLQNNFVLNAGLENLANLKNLDTLVLNYTSVDNAGLAQIANLPQLKHLHLIGTQITGAGLTALAGNTQLKTLKLDNNRLSNEGLANLSGLGSLETLSLRNCPSIGDAGIRHLSTLANLKSLDISAERIDRGGHVGDAGIEHLANLHNLTTLGLCGTLITNAALAHLKGMKNLQALNIRRCEITDRGLNQLLGHENLRALDIGGTRVSNGWLTNLDQLPSLTKLSVSNSRITDGGLANLCKLTNLKSLDLHGTEVTGFACPIDNLTRLTTLDLSYTKVRQPILFLEHMKSLQDLDLSGTNAASCDMLPLNNLPLRRIKLNRGLTDTAVDQLARLRGIEHIKLEEFNHATLTKAGKDTLNSIQSRQPLYDPNKPGFEKLD